MIRRTGSGSGNASRFSSCIMGSGVSDKIGELYEVARQGAYWYGCTFVSNGLRVVCVRVKYCGDSDVGKGKGRGRTGEAMASAMRIAHVEKRSSLVEKSMFRE